MTPYDDLAAAHDARAPLLAHLDELPVAQLTEPSLLPRWSRAHVVAHLAGNAWSHVGMLDGCLAGEARLLRPTDLPAMVVIADGVVTGSAGPRVTGSLAGLAAWLSGRSDGSDLRCRPGRERVSADVAIMRACKGLKIATSGVRQWGLQQQREDSWRTPAR